MTTNSQLSTTEPKNKKTKAKMKQTTRPGIKPQKWRSHGWLSVGRSMGRMGEYLQGIRIIDGRYKIGGG